VLNPGTHAEHKEVPYCHVPCYAALFGPKLFGHGSTTESHRSFGRREKSFIREQSELRTKLDQYNAYYADHAKSQLAAREVNGRLILEGIIKVYWGTEASVRLKEFDDTRLSNSARQQKTMSVGPDFMAPVDLLGIASESEDNEDETDGESSIPYFNPRTRPLYTESLKDLARTSLPQDPLYDKILDQALLEDVANDNLLSYDPIQKWKTLNNLVSESDTASELSPNVTVEDNMEEDNTSDEVRIQRSVSVHRKNENKNLLSARVRSSTLPSQFRDLKDDLDDLLQVERQIEDHEKVYHTVNSTLPISPEQDENKNLSPNKNYTQNLDKDSEPIESLIVKNEKSGKKFTVNKLSEKGDSSSVSFRLGVYESSAPSNTNDASKLLSSEILTLECENKEEKVEKRRGPRALRRRHGKRMDKKKLKRRSSINGHWYDRETAVFTPPKHTAMCVYTSSKAGPEEVVATLLEKYKIESSPGDYSLYLVRETGERRLVGDQECPLTLRVTQGPHEEVSKLYLMDRQATSEISGEVAQFLAFTMTELRSFLNMFYEEEEREADKIRTKFLVIRRRLEYTMRLKQGQGHVFVENIEITS